MDAPVEDLLRSLAPQVLGALARRHGDFAGCEDAVQEALQAAHAGWPGGGVPDNPRGWLLTVATRRLIDAVRSEAARTRREEAAAVAEPPPADVPARDDSLTLLFLCCHPSLTPPAQLALTLRACGGLTTAEIAGALLVPEATLAQRISRAKQRIRESGARFAMPTGDERTSRLAVVLQVLYLIFNEGYVASAGDALERPDLTHEAIRLTRDLLSSLPARELAEPEGLLALMLLTEARHAARTDVAGGLVPLTEQDRTRWDSTLVAEGLALVTTALQRGRPGTYQLQAAIAAVHAEAPTAEETDWPQVLGLYDVLERIAPSPVVALNRAVALGMVVGPWAALEVVDGLATGTLGGHHRLAAVRAHLLERAGDQQAAAAAYRDAAERAPSSPEQRFLAGKAASLTS